MSKSTTVRIPGEAAAVFIPYAKRSRRKLSDVLLGAARLFNWASPSQKETAIISEQLPLALQPNVGIETAYSILESQRPALRGVVVADKRKNGKAVVL